jgi:DNA-directed RNA polymerase subunit omega
MPETARPLGGSMMEPRIERLLARTDSKFTLVTLAAKRGREINSYLSQLSGGLGSLIPPQVVSSARKPLSIALEEIAAEKITYTRRDPSETAEGEGDPETEPAAE